MKNKICVIVVLFLFFKGSAQNIIVTYKKEFEKSILTETKKGQEYKVKNPGAFKKFRSIEKKQHQLAKRLEYSLTIADNKALFELKNNIMLKDSDKMGMAMALGVNTGIFYNNLEDCENIQQKEAFDKMFLVVLEPISWKLINETKSISGFTCKKAIAEKKIYSRNGEIEHEVVAWYTTEIPVNFGPIGYSGLPGLIVSLSVANERYYVNEIKMKKNEINLEKPKKGQEISYKEFSAMFISGLKNIAPN